MILRQVEDDENCLLYMNQNFKREQAKSHKLADKAK